MSTKTTNYNLHKIDLTDAPPDITVLNPNWDTIDAKLKELSEASSASSVTNVPNEDFAEKTIESGVGLPVVTAISGDGVTYIATVDGITELKAGLPLIIIPNVVSTNVLPKLNLNGLGAKGIKQLLSNNTATTVTAKNANWMAAGKPMFIYYNGTNWVTANSRSAAGDMYGTVAIENGGTGATTASGALANLGGAPMYTYSTVDLTAGTSSLETGKVYLVYD